MGKFIVIEGIDASGKSTIVTLVHELLASNNRQAYIATKKKPRTGDSDIDKYLSLLGQIVWPSGADSMPWSFLSEDQWKLQITLWYSVLSTIYIPQLCSLYDYVLIDGWYYKMHARFLHGMNTEFLNPILPSIDTADMVFLLDVDPECCWKRRKGLFSPTEISTYHSQVVDLHHSFISFQESIRKTLIDLSTLRGWHVIPNPDDSAIITAATIASYIISSVQ